MKHKCKDIPGLLVDYSAGELSAVDRKRVEAHLSTCPGCRAEVTLMQRLNSDSLRLDQDCRAIMAAIDWEDSAQTISDNIPFKTVVAREARESRQSWLPRFNFNWSTVTLNWKFALPAMTGIFVLGLWLGYLLFHNSSAAPSMQAAHPAQMLSQNLTPRQSPLARLENTLARKEVAGYFDQTELVLMDLMKQCNTDGSYSMHDQVDLRRVQELLSKNRYFKDSLDNPRLLSSKELMKKIEWLLYEILMSGTDEDSSCQKLQQLQNYIKDERLLMKMRLVGKELSLSEV